MKRILVLVSTLCLTGTLTGNVAAAGQGHGAGTAPSTVKSPRTPIKYSHPARVSPRSPSTLTRPVMVKVLAAHAARPGTQAVAHVSRVTALGIKAMPRTGGGSVLNAPALPALPMLPMLPTLPTLARLALLALGGVIRKLSHAPHDDARPPLGGWVCCILLRRRAGTDRAEDAADGLEAEGVMRQ